MLTAWPIPRFGFPPLARGEQRLTEWLQRQPRTTPARAGKTLIASWVGMASTDHPRLIRDIAGSFEMAWARAIPHADYKPGDGDPSL
ncbi:hypothetical protein Acsp04_66780 [Actinomadura sp. NBRC 104425]|nr:hypothetical protein Acsp04_66780 [Actinomadura sp. NBRC 104425]